MFTGLYKFGENCMKVLAAIFCALIFLSAFFLTAYNPELMGHLFELEFDNILFSLLGLSVIAIVGFFLYKLVKKNFEKRLNIFLYIVLAWYLLSGLYMAFFGRSMPNSDSWVVYAMSKSLAAGDLSIINPTESYMSYYPQQIGICTFLSWIIRAIDIFPVQIEEFHFLAAIYAVFEAITVFFMYKTVDALFNSKKANFIFLYISLFNFSYIMYSSYIYGEIPAMMLFSIGAYYLSCLYRGKFKTWVCVALSVLAFTLSVFTRKNTLVMIIGVLIVLLFQAMKEKRFKYLISAVLIGICSFLVLPITVKIYEKKAGNTLTTGVTALSYFAMGMQEADDVNPGWYTAFNINTFEESGCNPEIANKVSKEEIRARKEVFKKDPVYAVSFYTRKFLTQWVDGTYFSRESTYNYYGDRSGFLMSVYFGNLGPQYIYLCNVFQTMVFGGAFLWALFSFKKSRKEDLLFKSFIFVGIFGGFLFHMLWEANSRYILTYACMLVPYAASGIEAVTGGEKRLE